MKLYEEIITHHRGKILILSFLVIAFSSAGLGRLAFSSDNRYFFSEENPGLAALEEIESIFTKNNSLYLALEPEDGDIFTSYMLGAIKDLTESSWKIPYSSRVDSLTNFQHIKSEESELTVEDLVKDIATLTESSIDEIKKIALSEPLLVNNLVSPVGKMAGVHVNILNPGTSGTEIPEIIEYVRAMIKEFKEKFPDVKIYMAGDVPYDNAFGEVSEDDLGRLVLTMYLLMVVFIGVLLGSVSGAFVTLMVITMSALTALGIAGWLGIPLTTASIIAPTIILPLSVADSVHILTTIFYEMSIGKNKRDAIVESLKVNMHPLFLTSLTTTIGFLSFNASDAPPFHDLGNIVSIGVVAAFLYSIFLLPALIGFLPVKPRKKSSWGAKLIEKLTDLIVVRRNECFWVSIIFVTLLISGLVHIELDDRFSEYFDKRYDIRKDTDRIYESQLTGLDVIEYSIKGAGTGGITDPEYLRNLEKFAYWYKRQPETLQVVPFSHHIKRINKGLHAGDDNFFSIPNEQQTIAQYLLLYEMSLPFGLDMNSQVNIDKSATRFVVKLKELSSKEARNLSVRAQAWMKENLPSHMHSHASGLTLLWASISKLNTESMLVGTGIALLLVSAILVFATGSLKYGIISLLPNIVPALMAFGLWGFLFKEVGLAVSVVGAVSLGIVVDDTIYFLFKYLRARKQLDLNPSDSVKYVMQTAGTAVIVTSIVLVFGFLVLTLSGFAVNSSMGLLTAMAITFGLLTDLFLLLPLLMKVDKREMYVRDTELTYAGTS